MGSLRFWIIVLAAGAIALVNDWQPLDLALGVLVAIMVLAALWSRWSLSGITMERTLSRDQARVGEPVADRVTIQNLSRWPRLWVEVRDHSSLPLHQVSRVVHLRGRQTHSWVVETVCTRRGRYHVGPITLRAGDPFGLFPKSRAWSQSIDLTVFPPEFAMERFQVPLGTLTGAATREQRTPFVSPSVASVRDYVSGDAFNRISWTASARLGRLMVKEFDSDPTSDVWIVLDLDARFRVQAWRPDRAELGGPFDPMAWMETTDDYAASAAASIARICLEHGRGVGLVASGAHHEVIAAERSSRTHARIIETLAVVQADGSLPLAQTLVAEWRWFSRHSGVVLITSSPEENWHDAVEHLTARRVHVVVVYVDPASFQPGALPSTVPPGLASTGVPAYLVQYGTPIGTALNQALATRGG